MRMLRSLLPPVFLVQATPADTVAVLVPSSSLATAQAVSVIVLAVALVLVLLTLGLILMQIRGLVKRLGVVANRVERDSGPLMDRARSIAENVEFVTMSIRTDVQGLNDSVSRLNKRLKEASERMEERIQDFNALVDVMQSEAEGIALDTAAAVRGIKAGTGALTAGADDDSTRDENDQS